MSKVKIENFVAQATFGELWTEVLSLEVMQSIRDFILTEWLPDHFEKLKLDQERNFIGLIITNQETLNQGVKNVYMELEWNVNYPNSIRNVGLMIFNDANTDKVLDRIRNLKNKLHQTQIK